MSNPRRQITFGNIIQSAITLIGFGLAYQYTISKEDLQKFIITFTAATITVNQIRTLFPSIYYSTQKILTPQTLTSMTMVVTIILFANFIIQNILLSLVDVPHYMFTLTWMTLFVLMAVNVSAHHLYIQTSKTFAIFKHNAFAAAISSCYPLYLIYKQEIAQYSAVKFFLAYNIALLLLNTMYIVRHIDTSNKVKKRNLQVKTVIKLFLWDSLTRYIPLMERGAAATINTEFLIVIDSAQRFIIRPATLIYSGYVATEIRDQISNFNKSYDIQKLFHSNNKISYNFLKLMIPINCAVLIYTGISLHYDYLIVTMIYTVSQALIYWNDAARKAFATTNQIDRVMLYNTIQACLQVLIIFCTTYFELSKWLIPAALLLSVSVTYYLTKNRTSRAS